MMKKTLKKLTLLVLSLTLLAAMTACGASGSTQSAAPSANSTASTTDGESSLLKTIKDRGYIVIGSSNDAPFSYQNIDTGKLDGIDIEILKEICSRLGIPDVQDRKSVV